MTLSIGVGGCTNTGQSGETITVEAPPNDSVTWAAAPTLTACCPAPQCAVGGLANIPAGPVGANGLVTEGPFSGFEDDTPYSIVSTTSSPTPCIGVSNVVACGTVITLTCNAMPTNGAAGQITVSGSEEEYCRSHDSSLNGRPGPCPAGAGTTVCDVGAVSLTVDGHTVSAALSCASTARSVAFELALALDQDATLGTQFKAASAGPVAYVRAVNGGSQYNYSWTSSNSCSSTILSIFGKCSFSAGLSPAGALAGGQ